MTQSKNNNLLRIFICFLISFSSKAQEIPPIENYPPKVYGAENQNWGISQSEENFIYIANNSGLLEYNGSKWNLYPSPNKSVMRSVKVIGKRIYTGSFKEFGYWSKNVFGRLEYLSLTDKIEGVNFDDQHFWNIVDFEEWMLFQSLRNIYVYNTKTELFDVIPSETKISKVFKVDEGIYFQKMNDGIYKIENGLPLLVSDDVIVKKNEIVNIFSREGSILMVTQEKGIYLLKNKEVSKWRIEANSIISSISVYSSILLRDQSIILGTISNGVYQLDKSGKIINEINQAHGLNNNTVLSMFEDRDQNLWLGLDIGVDVINLKDPYQVFSDKNGVLGSVYASNVFQNNLYIGTNQGLYYRNKDKNEQFTFVEGTEGQVWNLKVINNTLFCGHNNGTYVVDSNLISLVSEVKGTWDIEPFLSNENLLLQGHYGGLNVLEKVNDTWRFRNNIDGFSESSRSFVLNNKNEVFVNHESKGVTKLILNDEFTEVIEEKLETSAPVGIKSSIVKYNKTLLYASREGVFKYNALLDKFEKDSLLSFDLFGNDNYVSGKLIYESKDNTLWGFSEKNIVRFSQGKLNDGLRTTKISLTSDSRDYIPGYENITLLSDNKYLFGASKGYMIIDLNKLTRKEYKLKLHSIEKSILNKNRIPIPLNVQADLEYKENNISFEYCVPEYKKYKEVNYQYQLKGIYEEWSDWSTTSEVFFKNLPFGEYTFNVRARIGDNEAVNVESYEFVVGKPWLLSNGMLLGYGLAVFLFSILMNRTYKKYYTLKHNKALERTERILRLENLENEKELMKFRNDNLRQDIESKNRELGMSTMSLIKKNEFLNSLKKELRLISDTPKLKKVIGIIDKNLNNTDDWKLFETAFNNADKGFLNKIKILHPQLTPNDLRLCAYLRMNLSSKEIAPLLNISPRSVEIKRYRLRKKIDLPHENNLTQYISEV